MMKLTTQSSHTVVCWCWQSAQSMEKASGGEDRSDPYSGGETLVSLGLGVTITGASSCG
jgi:hypothetical protein